MTLIGLTGLSCAGKNYLAGLLESKGIPVLDVDKLGHRALENRKDAVSAAFGPAALAPDGTVCRRALAALVFANPPALARLEGIVHPEVDTMIEDWLAQMAARQMPVCAVNAALLHKTAAVKRLRLVIAVTAPLFVRMARAKKRDGLSFKEIWRRFFTQRNFSPALLPAWTRIVRISNGGWGVFPKAGRRHLERRLDAVLQMC